MTSKLMTSKPMIDLSRVKLKEPWSDRPEEFFRECCDHVYSVKDLCIQRGTLSRAKVDREFRKYLDHFNASDKSPYPTFLRWWDVNGTKWRSTGLTTQVLIQDEGRIID